MSTGVLQRVAGGYRFSATSPPSNALSPSITQRATSSAAEAHQRRMATARSATPTHSSCVALSEREPQDVTAPFVASSGRRHEFQSRRTGIQTSEEHAWNSETPVAALLTFWQSKLERSEAKITSLELLLNDADEERCTLRELVVSRDSEIKQLRDLVASQRSSLEHTDVEMSLELTQKTAEVHQLRSELFRLYAEMESKADERLQQAYQIAHLEAKLAQLQLSKSVSFDCTTQTTVSIPVHAAHGKLEPIEFANTSSSRCAPPSESRVLGEANGTRGDDSDDVRIFAVQSPSPKKPTRHAEGRKAFVNHLSSAVANDPELNKHLGALFQKSSQVTPATAVPSSSDSPGPVPPRRVPLLQRQKSTHTTTTIGGASAAITNFHPLPMQSPQDQVRFPSTETFVPPQAHSSLVLGSLFQRGRSSPVEATVGLSHPPPSMPQGVCSIQSTADDVVSSPSISDDSFQDASFEPQSIARDPHHGTTMAKDAILKEAPVASAEDSNGTVLSPLPRVPKSPDVSTSPLLPRMPSSASPFRSRDSVERIEKLRNELQSLIDTRIRLQSNLLSQAALL